MSSRSRVLVLFILAVFLAGDLHAQNNVGINNPTPHASALLDLTSTDKGLLAPRMTTAQRTTIATPAIGLLVFDTSLNAFYFYSGTAWVALTTGPSGWGLSGNAGTNPVVHFIGTLDLVPLNFRVGMVRAGTLDFVNTSMGWSSGGMAMTGTQNSFYGAGSGGSTTNGNNNVFIGHIAGNGNTQGARNTAVGSMSAVLAALAVDNTFLGFQAGLATTGSTNTFIGSRAGQANLGAGNNVFVGFQSGMANTNGGLNTFLGTSSGAANLGGSENTFLGTSAGLMNTSGSLNTCVGRSAGRTISTSAENVFVGHNAGNSTTSGQNTFTGSQAGYNSIGGNGNTLYGFHTGYNNGTGSFNTYIGWGAGTIGNLTNATAIGANATASQNNSLILGGTGPNAVNVGIGNTAPASKLHVTSSPAGYAPSASAALTLEATGNVYANVISGAGESGLLFGSNNNAANGGVIYNSGFTPNGMQLRTGGNTPRLSISSTGEVTIADGTSWPGYKFGVIASQPTAMAALQNQDAAGYSGFHFINNTGTARAHMGAGNSASPNWVNMGYAGTYTAHPFVLTTNDIERLRIDAVGNVGIGTTAPAAMLEVNGFTKLGSNAPAVKTLKLTGTTAAVQGAATSIAHGLNPAKILAVSVVVEYTVNNYILASVTNLPGYEFNVNYNTSINVINVNGNSAFILSKPFKILITYEQ